MSVETLAEAMKARMGYLGLTSQEMSDRGGPARSGSREIFEGSRTPRKSTLEKIDLVLGWPAGMANAILHEECEPPPVDSYLELVDENRLGIIRSGLVASRREHQRLADYHREQADLMGSLVEILDTHIRQSN